MDFEYESDEEDDAYFTMKMPDFSIDPAILEYHGISVGDDVNFTYDTSPEGFELLIGSKSRKEHEQRNPIEYDMPNAFIDYFCGDMHTSKALNTLSRALNTPYESCVAEPPVQELTVEERTVTLAETKLAETIAPLCDVILNPTKSAAIRFDKFNPQIEIVYTCTAKEFASNPESVSVYNTIPKMRIKHTSWAQLKKIIDGKMTFFGYNYDAMIAGGYKGYAMKVNLPNSLVYGLNIVDYQSVPRQFDPDLVGQEWGVAYPKTQIGNDSPVPRPIVTYKITAKRKQGVRTTRWGDPMLPYLAYDLVTMLPQKMSSSKNFKLNCFSVVTSEIVNLAVDQVGFPMYSPVGFGYPMTYTQDLIRFVGGPLEKTTNFVGRFCDTPEGLKLVDIVYPALAWESRVDIITRYGYFYQAVGKNWVKANPRISSVQVYMDDNNSSIVLKGKVVSADSNGDIETEQGRFRLDKHGNFLLVNTASGKPLIRDPSVRVVVVDSKNAFKNESLSTWAFENIGHVKFVAENDETKAYYKTVRKFMTAAHYVPGMSIKPVTSYQKDQFLRRTGTGTWDALLMVPPLAGESTLLTIPDGLKTHRFTPYNKYEIEFQV